MVDPVSCGGPAHGVLARRLEVPWAPQPLVRTQPGPSFTWLGGRSRGWALLGRGPRRREGLPGALQCGPQVPWLELQPCAHFPRCWCPGGGGPRNPPLCALGVARVASSVNPHTLSRPKPGFQSNEILSLPPSNRY